MPLKLGGYGPLSVQFRSCAQWRPSLRITYGATGWQASCKRQWQKASCHLLATQNQNRFHLRQDTSHSATVRRKRVVSTLTSDVYSLLLLCQTYMKVRINLATKCLLPSFLKSLCNNNTVREKVISLQDIMWRSTSAWSNSITSNPITLIASKHCETSNSKQYRAAY